VEGATEMADVKVLFVIHYPVFGGPHNQALLLARELERRGLHMTVLLPAGPGNAVPRLRSSGIDVVSVPLHRARATVDPRPLLQLAAHLPSEVRAIRRVIREREIDIVQIGGLVNPHAAIAGKLEGVAVVWQLLDTRAPMVIRRMMMPFVVHLSDALMTTGRTVATVHPGAEALAERLVVFFPPVDPTAFDLAEVDRAEARAEFGFGPDDLVIGTVGNLNPQKGHEYLLRAAAQARAVRPNARVLIVGASHETHRGYERDLHTLAEELGFVVGKDVTFSGTLDDVRPALAAMDVFVLSSVPRSEGAPTAVEEAMMMKRPVIAANVGAISELVDDGVTGLLVPPLDSAAISDAIVRTADNPALRAAMGAQARERAIALCSVEECARIHLEAYDRALSHRRGGYRGANKRRFARTGAKP
jgi:glycosyltransferase involved in cell wall biosynthesis